MGVALSAASAGLATLSFGPYHLWWLIFVAFVPMIVAQHRFLSLRWSGLAFSIGIGGFVTGYLYGLVDDGFAWWMRLIPLVVAVPLFFAGRGERGFHEATAYRWVAFTTPLAWTAADFLRSSVPMVATRAAPSYALFDQPWLIQPVSIVGIAGLNLMILAVNWTIAAAVLAYWDGQPSRRQVHRHGKLLGLAAVVWVIASLAMLNDPEATVRVAAIQPGTTAQDEREFGRNVAQTRAAAAQGAELIVWREKTLTYDPAQRRTAELQALATETGAYLAIGYGFDTPEGQRNEATIIAPDGTFLGAYGKQHPALMFADDETSISRGNHPTYDTGIGRLATIICYDLDFLDTARHMARNGAQLVAVPSWDPAGDATKHYPLLVFRAIENRLTMVKADAAYDSAIIDPYGRILDRAVTPGGAAATIVADVPLGTGDSTFVRFGPWFGWVTVALLVAVPVLSRRPHGRGG